MADRPPGFEPANDPDMPARLIEALDGLYAGQSPAVPGTVDEAVLREARAGFSRRRRFWLYARGAGAAAAASAAALVVIAVYIDRHRSAPSPVAVTPVVPPGDVDRNGRVDVLDALVLAKKVEAGASGTPARGEDVTGDGLLDRGDVDRVAAMAVSIEPPAGGLQ